MFVYHSALGGFKHIKARKQVTVMSTMERKVFSFGKIYY